MCHYRVGQEPGQALQRLRRDAGYIGAQCQQPGAVADVFVGTVRAIGVKNWVATLNIEYRQRRSPAEERHRGDRAAGLLGSQHVELSAPPDPSPQPLGNGDTIPLVSCLHTRLLSARWPASRRCCGAEVFRTSMSSKPRW